MGGRSQKKSEQTNYDRQKAFIYQMLAELSPENIAKLQRMILPHIMAQQSSINQTALHQLQRVQAHKGIAQSPISGSQQLGLTSSLANSAQAQAFQQAFGLAGQRAGAWAGTPSQTQPNYHMANALQQAIQQGLLAAALGQKNRQPQEMGAPMQSNVPNFGLPPTYWPSNTIY